MKQIRFSTRPRPRIRRPAGTMRLAGSLCLLLPAAGCSGEGSLSAAEGPLQGELRRREATRVRTEAVVKREMVRTLSTATTVESEAEIVVYPRAAGVVIELLVEEGDSVEAEQVLARLDDRAARAAKLEAEIAVREAQETIVSQELMKAEASERHERAKLTYEQAVRDHDRNERAGLISAQDLDRLALARDTAQRDQQAARVAYELAEAQRAAALTSLERSRLAVERAELELSFMEVLAPIAGVIAQRGVRVGDSVSGATSAFVLTDPEHLRAVFHRPQRELPLFRSALPAWRSGAQEGASDANGLAIRITSEAIPGIEFVGRIQLVSPTIDIASGSFRITVGIEHPEQGPRLLPGMLVRLEVVTDRHPEALVVPKRAMVREGEASHVFRVDEEGRARRVAVREGYSEMDHVEVIPLVPGALEAGSEVVVVGNRDLEEGELVLAGAGQGADAETAPAGE